MRILCGTILASGGIILWYNCGRTGGWCIKGEFETLFFICAILAFIVQCLVTVDYIAPK